MAAHIITAFNEAIQYNTPEQFASLAYGCGYGAFGNQLESSEYSIILAICECAKTDIHRAKQALRDLWFTYISPRVYREYEQLGTPDTFEAWMNAIQQTF